MRVKTRSGFYTNLPNDSVISQEKHITRHETFYVLNLRDGRKVSTSEPVNDVLCTIVNETDAYKRRDT